MIKQKKGVTLDKKTPKTCSIKCTFMFLKLTYVRKKISEKTRILANKKQIGETFMIDQTKKEQKRGNSN